MQVNKACDNDFGGVVASSSYAPANVHPRQFADEHLIKERGNFPCLWGFLRASDGSKTAAMVGFDASCFATELAVLRTPNWMNAIAVRSLREPANLADVFLGTELCRWQLLEADRWTGDVA